MSDCSPSIVIHGGAGAISRSNVPPSSDAYKAYVTSLHHILRSTYSLLSSPTTTAIDAACHAVVELENNPFFNAGKGAVFTRAGTNELEASVMVTRGAAKRGVGVMLLKRVKNPVLLARELLVRSAEEGGSRHNQLSGEEAEKLAEKWGVELVDEKYFWTEKRWKEHLRGLEREKGAEMEAMQATPVVEDSGETEEVEEYLPKGTVGCVVRDRWGTICVATSTGGLTNKLPGRIGDTPTLGTGFWAEEWEVERGQQQQSQALDDRASDVDTDEAEATKRPKSVWGFLFGANRDTTQRKEAAAAHTPLLQENDNDEPPPSLPKRTRAVGLSGTGNGDYFLRLSAAHTVAARCRFGNQSLREALEAVVGEGGEMQQAAEDVGEWGQGGGQGGIIGIDESGNVEMVLNCGGMFRGTIDQDGESIVAVYRDEELSREE